MVWSGHASCKLAVEYSSSGSGRESNAMFPHAGELFASRVLGRTFTMIALATRKHEATFNMASTYFILLSTLSSLWMAHWSQRYNSLIAGGMRYFTLERILPQAAHFEPRSLIKRHNLWKRFPHMSL
jgi:hypothetical protein